MTDTDVTRTRADKATVRAPGGGRHGGPAGARPSVNRRRTARREAAFGYVMISFGLVFVLVFTLLPILASFGLSFFSWDVISPPSFVGLQNYRTMASDPAVLDSVGVTVLLAAAIVVVQLTAGLGLALLVLQRRRRWAQTTFRTIFYLPLLASTASVSIFMGYLFDEKFGLVNYYLGLVGISNVPWLTSRAGAVATIVFVAAWQQVGFTFVLFLASLIALPTDVMEAVALDGAGPLRTLVQVKLPLISPTVFFATVIGVINALQLFDQPYIMVHGGPGHATRTTVMVIYESAFQNLEFGYGSAIAIALLLVILAVTGLQFLIGRKAVFYQ